LEFKILFHKFAIHYPLSGRDVLSLVTFLLGLDGNMYRKILLCLLLIFSFVEGFSQIIIREDTVQCSIYFHQGKSYFDPIYKNNGKHLKEFVNNVYFRSGDPSMSIKRIVVNSGASPEGPTHINDRLSQERADAIISYLKRNSGLDESMIIVQSPGVDWVGLTRIVEKSDEVPDKEEVLAILYSEEFGDDDIARRKRLEALNGGKPYKWLYVNYFPLVRHSHASIAYVSRIKKELMLAQGPQLEYPMVEFIDNSSLISPAYERPDFGGLYMSLQTNLLYDILATPNIGVEFYLGKGFSLDANWMYAWWHSDPAHFYWRNYGGDLALRWWFGRKAKAKPLTGHHLGIYGQVLTYDYAFGGRGQIGGVPGGAIWDRTNYGGGLEYGYSVPVAKRLNLDFTIGAGYLGGEYHDYVVQDDCYVWQATKHRHWFGPTKAEISLVWLIGRNNYNRGKGGLR